MLDFIVLAAGSFLHAAALPNELVSDGWGGLGLLALFPVFCFTLRRSPGVSALGGILWIFLLTLLSQIWLLSFHPLAFPLVLAFQVPWYAGAFAGSSWLWRRFPGAGPWLQAAFWTGFEFLRIQGFFSYPYGSVASTFWAFPLTWQSADLVGTSGLTFLLAWGSAWGAAVVCRLLPWVRLRWDLAVGLSLWAADLGYGLWQWSQPQGGPIWHPVMVQQSRDPWKGGAEEYEASFDVLQTLSEKALTEAPDAVIWSETAFVPSVAYHKKYRDNPDSLLLVRRLESFLESTHVPFLIGNDHREKANDGTPVDYNAVLSWENGWTGRYEKNRLVPFTESFPYKDQLPGIYRWLVDSDTHFWARGHGWHLLTVGGVPVGTPVCFEDSFPEGPRAFNLAGAKALANLTNDAWSAGTSSRTQHLALAVFRSVETRMPLVRAGNDGATVAVSLRGEVTGRLPVGPPGILKCQVRLGSGIPTLYSKAGDWWAWICTAASLGSCVWPLRRRSIVDKGRQL